MDKKLIIQPTDIAEWEALINEAQQASTIRLNEDMESYLVYMLMRFTKQPEIASSVLAMEFLENLSPERPEALRDVGDKCLLFSGLFPGRAQKKQVKISYFVNIGQSAYATLSAKSEASLSGLYQQLYTDFVPLMDVLQASRTLCQSSILTAIEAEELWQDTGSREAMKRFHDMVDDASYIETPNKK